MVEMTEMLQVRMKMSTHTAKPITMPREVEIPLRLPDGGGGVAAVSKGPWAASRGDLSVAAIVSLETHTRLEMVAAYHEGRRENHQNG